MRKDIILKGVRMKRVIRGSGGSEEESGEAIGERGGEGNDEAPWLRHGDG